MPIITYIDDGTYITDAKTIKRFLKDLSKVRSKVPDSWEKAFEFLDSVEEYVDKYHRYTVKQADAVFNLETAIETFTTRSFQEIVEASWYTDIEYVDDAGFYYGGFFG